MPSSPWASLRTQALQSTSRMGSGSSSVTTRSWTWGGWGRGWPSTRSWRSSGPDTSVARPRRASTSVGADTPPWCPGRTSRAWTPARLHPRWWRRGARWRRARRCWRLWGCESPQTPSPAVPLSPRMLRGGTAAASPGSPWLTAAPVGEIKCKGKVVLLLLLQWRRGFSAHRLHLLECVGVQRPAAADLRRLGASASLPLRVQGEQHEAPRRGHGSRLVAGEVYVLAVVHYEAVGGVGVGEAVVGAAEDGMQQAVLRRAVLPSLALLLHRLQDEGIHFLVQPPHLSASFRGKTSVRTPAYLASQKQQRRMKGGSHID